jgi:hypothetical protein
MVCTEDQGTCSDRRPGARCATQAWGTARLALLSGLLFLPCAVLQLVNAWSAKRFRERNLHAGLPVALSGVAFMCARGPARCSRGRRLQRARASVLLVSHAGARRWRTRQVGSAYSQRYA